MGGGGGGGEGIAASEVPVLKSLALTPKST